MWTSDSRAPAFTAAGVTPKTEKSRDRVPSKVLLRKPYPSSVVTCRVTH